MSESGTWIKRRRLLGGLAGTTALASIGVFAGSPAAAGASAPDRPRALVAYLSRSGNTRVVAGLVHRRHQTDLFEITPADAYPADYEATVAQVSQELDRDYQPPLDVHVDNIADYDRIYLAFPIWAMTLPPPARRFLSDHALTDQTIVPLITHGGYGRGDSLEVIARLAPDAQIEAPFVMEGEQERRVMNRVNDWMDQAVRPERRG